MRPKHGAPLPAGRAWRAERSTMRSRSGGSGGPAGEELPEEFAAFSCDPRGGLDVGLGARLGVELREGDTGLQESFRVRKALERLVGGGDEAGRIVAPGLPLRLGAQLREQAGAVEVQEGREDVAGEGVDEPGAPGLRCVRGRGAFSPHGRSCSRQARCRCCGGGGTW